MYILITFLYSSLLGYKQIEICVNIKYKTIRLQFSISWKACCMFFYSYQQKRNVIRKPAETTYCNISLRQVVF